LLGPCHCCVLRLRSTAPRLLRLVLWHRTCVDHCRRRHVSPARALAFLFKVMRQHAYRPGDHDKSRRCLPVEAQVQYYGGANPVQIDRNFTTFFDFLVAVEHAKFWVPEVELGSAFTGGPALVMAARLGQWRAKEAMILCRHFTARDLYELGMANRVVQDGDLMPAVRELAEELLKLPQKAATKTKHFVDGVFIGPRLY